MSFLITLEGIDGAGKSTLAKELAAAIEADPAFSDWVYLTKEPGSKWIPKGQDIRKLALETPDFKPFERELLFYVDASMHTRFINNQGDSVVVSDRGLWSHLAYLRGYLKIKEIDYETYALCKKVIDKVCKEPDCVVYFRGDLELMRERLAGKSKDIIESNGEAFYEAVLETYEDLVTQREWDGKGCVVLDPRLPTGQNTMKVLTYLKEVYDANQLRSENN